MPKFCCTWYITVSGESHIDTDIFWHSRVTPPAVTPDIATLRLQGQILPGHGRSMWLLQWTPHKQSILPRCDSGLVSAEHCSELADSLGSVHSVAINGVHCTFVSNISLRGSLTVQAVGEATPDVVARTQ